MTDERTICRFCLSSNNLSANPLISPCNCKGSLEFVHSKCLTRWRRVDIERNGKTCSICLAHYTFLQPIQLERIPEVTNLVVYSLEYPGLLLLLYNYLYALVLSSSSHPDGPFLHDYYISSQYVFHFVYAFFFYTEWNVVNKPLYWNQLKTLWTPVVVGGHLCLVVLLNQNAYFLGPFLSFYMGIYWRCHKHFLRTNNMHLAQLHEE